MQYCDATISFGSSSQQYVLLFFCFVGRVRLFVKGQVTISNSVVGLRSLTASSQACSQVEPAETFELMWVLHPIALLLFKKGRKWEKKGERMRKIEKDSRRIQKGRSKGAHFDTFTSAMFPGTRIMIRLNWNVSKNNALLRKKRQEFVLKTWAAKVIVSKFCLLCFFVLLLTSFDLTIKS